MNYDQNGYIADTCPAQPLRLELDDLPYTPVMAYVPWQSAGKMYSDEQALQRGTLFCVLDKPYYGKGGCCRDR